MLNYLPFRKKPMMADYADEGVDAISVQRILVLIMRIRLGNRPSRNGYMRFKGSRRERRHDNEPLNDRRSEERFYYLAVGRDNPLPTKRPRGTLHYELSIGRKCLAGN